MSKGPTLRERLAALEHLQWAHWLAHMLDNMTPDNIERWRRQANTPYSKLSEGEKNSDRRWADKVLNRMREPDEAMVEAAADKMAEMIRADREGRADWSGEEIAQEMWRAAVREGER